MSNLTRVPSSDSQAISPVTKAAVGGVAIVIAVVAFALIVKAIIGTLIMVGTVVLVGLILWQVLKRMR